MSALVLQTRRNGLAVFFDDTGTASFSDGSGLIRSPQDSVQQYGARPGTRCVCIGVYGVEWAGYTARAEAVVDDYGTLVPVRRLS